MSFLGFGFDEKKGYHFGFLTVLVIYFLCFVRLCASDVYNYSDTYKHCHPISRSLLIYVFKATLFLFIFFFHFKLLFFAHKNDLGTGINFWKTPRVIVFNRVGFCPFEWFEYIRFSCCKSRVLVCVIGTNSAAKSTGQSGQNPP